MILITGGCRSGKSRFALDYANRHFSKKLYLATCEALDEEMAQRIEHHKKMRGPEWRTIEEPIEIVDQNHATYGTESGGHPVGLPYPLALQPLDKVGRRSRIMEEIERSDQRDAAEPNLIHHRIQ